MDKAQELWFYGWDKGWVGRKASYASIQESVAEVCEMAKREGILHKFQDAIPELPKPGDGAYNPGSVSSQLDHRKKLRIKSLTDK